MKRLGYWLGALSFVWLIAIGGADFPPPFWEHALIILGGVFLGIVGLLLSIRLIKKAEQKEMEDYRLLIEGRKSSLLRQCRRIAALKKK
jgi:hypothetical protein